MPFTHEDLRKYLERLNIKHKILMHEETYSAKKASAVLGIDLSKIAKTIVFIDENNEPLLVIMPGTRRVNQNRLAKILGKKRIRLARPDEVLEFTGYEVGAVPPVGHIRPIRTIIDEELLKWDVVSAGGGSVNATLEISPKDIVKLQNAEVMKVP